MEHTLNLHSLNQHNEIEWTETFVAYSKKAVRTKATKWINKNLFISEITIDKNFTNLRRETWWLS